MTVGEHVYVIIDYGKDLPDTISMTIRSCSITDGTQSIEFITNGEPLTALGNMVKIVNTTSSREVRFEWSVFQVGFSSTMTLMCSMIVKRIVEPIPAVLVLSSYQRLAFL